MTTRHPGRRAILSGSVAALVAGAAPAQALRLGVVQSGTVQWIADVIKRHGLDQDVTRVPLADTDASRIGLMAGSVDVAVSDWPFVAVQRAAGRNLVFSPLSNASGALMVPSGSPIKTLADLRGKKLGVAGGPLDKSWLVVKAAAAKAYGIDLTSATTLAFGAPAVIGAKLRQGELEAALTFWNFAARLQAIGFHAAVTVADASRLLGLQGAPFLLGYVFHQNWALANRGTIDRFLTASATATSLLAKSPAEWDAVRPLMAAPQNAVFDALRQRFIEGLGHPDAASQARQAASLIALLLAAGGPKATGGVTALPQGVFWPGTNAG